MTVDEAAELALWRLTGEPSLPLTASEVAKHHAGDTTLLEDVAPICWEFVASKRSYDDDIRPSDFGVDWDRTRWAHLLAQR